MDITLEQVEKVCRFTGVTPSEAKAALEQAGGSPLDAVLYLEKLGRIPSTPGGAWSTRYGAPPEQSEQPGQSGQAAPVPARPWGRNRTGSGRRPFTAQEVKDAIRSLLRNCTRITIDVWRGDDLLVGIPLIICVLLFLIAYYIMIPLAIVGLALRCRYHIGGWEEAGAEAINRTMDQVTDTVADWTDQLRSELRSEHDKKKNKKK